MLLLEQSGYEMFKINLLMTIADGLALRSAKRLLGLFSEPVEIHMSSPTANILGRDMSAVN